MALNNRMDYEQVVDQTSIDDENTSDATINGWYEIYRMKIDDTKNQGGPGRIVNLNETMIGKKKYNRRLVDGT